MFGPKAGQGVDISKSNVLFSESTIEGGADPLNRTRNAIDRFTGGAGDQKLFTTQAYYGGEVALVVRRKKKIPGASGAYIKLLDSLIEVTIRDLREGHAAIGGMTSVGGGILAVREGSDDGR
jgi:hypothetical protein